jgi:hypothetical protein
VDIKDAERLAHKRHTGSKASLDTKSGVATAGVNEAGDTKSKTPGVPDVGEDGDWLPS